MAWLQPAPGSPWVHICGGRPDPELPPRSRRVSLLCALQSDLPSDAVDVRFQGVQERLSGAEGHVWIPRVRRGYWSISRCWWNVSDDLHALSRIIANDPGQVRRCPVHQRCLCNGHDCQGLQLR